MKKVTGYLSLMIAVVSAIIMILTTFGILFQWLSVIFHLLEPTTPEYIFSYIWWKFLGSIILTLVSVKVCLMSANSKKVA